MPFVSTVYHIQVGVAFNHLLSLFAGGISGYLNGKMRPILRESEPARVDKIVRITYL
jgi:hypothetical protein